MNISIVGARVKLELEWYEQLWAFTLNKIWEIPLSHITSATSAEPRSSWSEIRAPGTSLPGVIKAGTYYSSRGKEFWYVTKERDYLTLELQAESFKRIILTIDDSEAWVSRINQSKSS